jgi:MYXO-CTERM domain-containing protein
MNIAPFATGSVLALACASAAAGDVVVTFTALSANGFQFYSIAQVGQLTGTLTTVGVNAVLDASTNGTTADDLCLYLTPTNTLALNGRLQVGGFTNLNAQDRYFWANGGSSTPGTPLVDTIDVSALNINAANFRFWLGNGFGVTGANGVWTGTLTLFGVEAVPGPGALALLGLAGLAARRRRR